MQRSDLEHPIRAAAGITNQCQFVIIGSQAIPGSVATPPPERTLSREADIHPLPAPEPADLIDGAIGDLSHFHDHFGYCAQGVGPETARLPRGGQGGWACLLSAATNDRAGDRLDPVDLFVSKACAARDKDLVFNRALLVHRIVTLDAALARAGELEDAAEAARAAAWIRRLSASP